MNEITLELPLPPTINHYWGFSGHRRFLTLQAREFKFLVAHKVSQKKIKFGDARLCLTITLNFKDRRRQDISNRIKALEDALVQAGLFDDDSQIDEEHIYRGQIIKAGKVFVKISKLPNKNEV